MAKQDPQETIDTRVRIPTDSATRLDGFLAVPPDAVGVVVFAHGSGSGRFSPRNTSVAQALGAAGFATLLFDLLTEPEATVHANLFDVPFLTDRLRAAAAWTRQQEETRDLPMGYFGASTGAAAAMTAAATDHRIRAVVARGGRPELARRALLSVKAPTLLIAGGEDPSVLHSNELAYQQLAGERRLVVVPGATHLFEEPGKLDEVTRLATAWFSQYLRAPGTSH